MPKKYCSTQTVYKNRNFIMSKIDILLTKNIEQN